ncbi:MAG: lasso peptide biosynthesis B2 protein [Porticoccaceae bacterium]
MSLWHKINKKFRQWQKLAPWERLILVRVTIYLPIAWLSLRLLSFTTLQRLSHRALSTHFTESMPTVADTAYAQRCAELTAIAARHCLPSGSCLPQALVLCRFLRKKGLDAQLRIGVKPGTHSVQAHAWVEYRTQALNQEETHYHVFPTLG